MAKKPHRRNEGFSLVELIIVMAIMVALIAVIAPTYVKYVAKAKDAVITQAAGDVLEFAKSAHADLHLSGNGVIKVASNSGDLVKITFMEGNTFTYCDVEDEEAEKKFSDDCGLSPKTSTSTLAYYITISGDSITSSDTIEMTNDRNGHTGE